MSGNYEHYGVLYKVNTIVDIMNKLKKKVYNSCDILAVDKWVISLKGYFVLNSTSQESHPGGLKAWKIAGSNNTCLFEI